MRRLPAPLNPRTAAAAWGRRLAQSEYLILGLCLVYFAALAPFTEGLASGQNLANILSAMLPLLVVAVGQTFVLIGGGIDLSVTSTIALASVTGAFVMTADGGWLAGHSGAVPAGLAAMLGIGLLVGWGNGLAVTRLRMPPFIVTLTSMMFLSGLAIWLTQSRSIRNLPPAFNALGGLSWGQFPVLAFPLVLAVAGLAHLMLSRSVYGRWLYAVGHNAETSRVSGVPVGRTLLLTYVVAGGCAAVAAILITGKLEAGAPVHGQRMLLDVIGATVIGGTSLFGGKGKVLWTVWGVLFLTIIDNSLNLLNLSYFTITMVKGGVILAAALADAVKKQGTNR